MSMQMVLKLFISLIIIALAQYIAQTRPSLAGLIGVMPLTGLIVMLLLWHNSGGDRVMMSRYTLGAICGIVPSIFFFISAYLCFRLRIHLGFVLGISTAIWIVGALLHQHFLRPY